MKRVIILLSFLTLTTMAFAESANTEDQNTKQCVDNDGINTVCVGDTLFVPVWNLNSYVLKKGKVYSLGNDKFQHLFWFRSNGLVGIILGSNIGFGFSFSSVYTTNNCLYSGTKDEVCIGDKVVYLRSMLPFENKLSESKSKGTVVGVNLYNKTLAVRRAFTRSYEMVSYFEKIN